MSSDSWPELPPDVAEQVERARNQHTQRRDATSLGYTLDDPARWAGSYASLVAPTATPLPYDERSNAMVSRISRGGAVAAFRDNIGLAQFVSFVPFADRPYNQLRLLYQMGQFVQELAPTNRKFATQDIFNYREELTRVTESSGASIPDSFAAVHGAWQLPAESGSSDYNNRVRFSNPNYVHAHTYQPVTDAAAQRARLRDAADLGVVRMTTLIPLLGYADRENPAKTIHDRATALGVRYEARRLVAMRRLARLWAILGAWGYSQRDIAAAFGVGQSSVQRWQRWVVDAGFEPPAFDPTMPEKYREQDIHARVDIRASPRSFGPWGE